ncbi:MAG: GNAT family N-acetyltransferase [Aquamicrobium sp.]|uniref:GNAT family N-acetyltransferase n=1 Tax=Mesorhizobium sp. Pch-S TaxID=2082387 RepID=UPI001012CC82|nr:GNAT family N-acetyltransferase [Mesorhizobium sp. Pch-S]MBR2692270.1 GNAT family N-acetyltransferase [Aquamicrobium sp.]QAZ46355.1 N-acetyltransferase [Mesorhizobium sp. Pch-S]
MHARTIHAENCHLDWLLAHDRHAPEQWIRRCLSLGEYIIAELEGEPAGLLRFSWFWGTIPFMDLIMVLPDRRRSGIGTALFRHWEAAMRDAGATLLMTSSQADEAEPQAWHRRNGFRDAGSVSFGHLQPVAEVFLVKDLR